MKEENSINGCNNGEERKKMKYRQWWRKSEAAKIESSLENIESENGVMRKAKSLFGGGNKSMASEWQSASQAKKIWRSA
jgi:hypothetical protein